MRHRVSFLKRVNRKILEAIEQRILQHQQRVSRGIEIGLYPRALLWAGLRQDDVSEYGSRYRPADT